MCKKSLRRRREMCWLSTGSMVGTSPPLHCHFAISVESYSRYALRQIDDWIMAEKEGRLKENDFLSIACHVHTRFCDQQHIKRWPTIRYYRKPEREDDKPYEEFSVLKSPFTNRGLAVFLGETVPVSRSETQAKRRIGFSSPNHSSRPS